MPKTFEIALYYYNNHYHVATDPNENKEEFAKLCKKHGAQLILYTEVSWNQNAYVKDLFNRKSPKKYGVDPKRSSEAQYAWDGLHTLTYVDPMRDAFDHLLAQFATKLLESQNLKK